MTRFILLPGLVLSLVAPTAGAQTAVTGATALHNLMPVPATVSIEAGGLPIDSRFSVAFSGYKDARLEAAAKRMVERIARQTGIPILPKSGIAVLTVKCGKAAGRVQQVIEDESYSLKVTASGATLTAPTSYGVLRGFATFVQLIEPSPAGFVATAATIEDRPRFPWRGLMIDAGRHWQPIEVIKRNLDAMAAVKLNVFHWHLSEDQGFRVESKLYPKLQELGSDGLYYTQAQVREIVRYAADRGIRVVPEFDVPGHTGAWLVGYPHLASGPGPYEIQRRWGVFDPVLDPTNEQVYVVLERLFGEMAALFPDAFFHIGGDEVNGKQWAANKKIQAFMKRRGFKTDGDLHAYFNKRLNTILKKHHKIMVGWDEILHPDLPKDIVVQSWRGQKALADAARAGYRGILSNGYYLDYMWSTERHYLVDPVGKDAEALSDQQKARILGGEATMWSEWTTPEMIDSRTWPRTAAIAERYWSPATVRDVEDMYRRLDVVSRRLDFTGVLHRTAYRPMLERMTGGRPADALEGIVNLVEPVREYNRGRGLKQTQQSPLTRVIDAARPESEQARVFARLVDGLLADPAKKANRPAIERSLREWQDDAAAVQPLLDGFLLLEAKPIVERVSGLSALALRALQAIDQGTALKLSPEDTSLLAEAAKPMAEVHLMIVPPIRKIVDAAAGR
jgi:hexosaminidase